MFLYHKKSGKYEWKVVGDNKGEGFRTLTRLIDEYSASTLKNRNWKIYLGPGRVKLPGKVVKAQVNEGSRPSA